MKKVKTVQHSLFRAKSKTILIAEVILVLLFTVCSRMHAGPTDVSSSELNLIEQQQGKITVTGKVIDDLDEPLVGVSVSLKNASTGSITDANGNYSIQVNSAVDVLSFSYIGCQNQEVTVGNRTTIDVRLLPDTKVIDEVVVVGYGTQRKIHLTGSVGTINTEKSLASRPVTNVQELFAGSVPGLNVTKGTGAVGSGASVNIRGTSTIGTSSGILYIIDGFPGNINTLNPNDIESISILKDAASAAIYGSRAANGVIVVTTKKGKEMSRPTVEVVTSIGVQNPQFKIDFVDSENFMKLWDQTMVNDGKSPTYGEQGINDLRAGKYADVKWYKEIYKKNTPISNNYVALSGQEKNITYRFSGSYDYQDGTLPNNNYERYILKPDMTIKLSDKVSFTGSLQYTETQIEEPQGGTDIYQTQSARIAPTSFVREANGLYGVGSSMAGNPIAGVNQGGYKENKYREFMTILGVSYSPINNLEIKGNFANYTYDYWAKNRVSTHYLYDANGNVAKTVNPKSVLRQDNNGNSRTSLQLTTDYSISFNKLHNFKLLAGYSQEYFKIETLWTSRDNMPFPEVDVMDAGLTNKQNGGNANDAAIQSLFGRINYDYQSRYLFGANIRMDGSSRFAKGHRWGSFPSFSAGWNISEEAFMENVDWLSSLKLRASWGLLGDAEKVSYYETAATLTYNPSAYVFNNTLVPGAYNKKSVNTDISWEQSAMTNFGLDFSGFNQKIRVSLDYFINKRNDILYQAPSSLEFGLAPPFSNLLKMENKGFELLAGYDDRSGDFSWGINVSLSNSKNKVLDLGGKPFWIEGNTYTKEGEQYQLPYGYIADGLFQNEAEITGSAAQLAKLYPGNIRFKDLNTEGSSKGKIDGGDRAIISDKTPWNYGFNLNFGYKHFDFSANLYGKLNTFRYMSGYEGWAFYLSQNARPMHNDSWSPTNPGASYPRLSMLDTSNDYAYSSYWYRNSDYLKLQNLQLGYTFSQDLLKKINMAYLRMYISGQNVATFTKYDGFDPEGGYYPLSRTWSLGIHLKF